MKKKFWAALWLTIILTLSMVSIACAATVASGECGEQGGNVTWVLDDTGTLTISGTGAMKDCSEYLDDILWYYNVEEIEVVIVIIDNGVTSIGDSAFSGCDSLTSITIPASVTSIENHAFANCSNLRSITIPNSVTSIGDYAFASCSNLRSITIPNSVTSIGDYAFASCSNLTSITIPNSITNIKPQAFYSCQNVKDIYYNGSESEWTKFSIALDKKFLLNATIHFVDKQSNDQISIVLNGNPLSFSQAPYMANNTTMVPMRVIFEALDAEVNYDSASQKIAATKGDTTIELTLGQKTAKKNGECIALDAAAVPKSGSTMVPLRFVAEALQAQVDWDGATRTVSIALK